ncbi:Cellulose synthase 4 [Phytophthora cinnamomi]|uniref:Cellulose synthase 4 n=1 Tax=Phytophthora cinnamomi TaxID=4785 RepID=UPI00355A23A3|nr:Cellulose synthase 4 [Phytophthora cinnamomi]
MRSFNGGGVCAYGLNGQAGFLFERSQNALRQRRFDRARGFISPALKRSRDQDSDSSDDERPGQRPVLDGVKRMRLSSPKSDVDSDMTDEEAATPRATWRANKAIVPAAPETGKKRPLVFAPAVTEGVEVPWKVSRQEEFLGAEGPVEIPNDASCRAMVVFDPYQSMNLSPQPRVELVEDETLSETDAASESDEDNRVRFEELPSDNDEPVDMDVD